MENQYGFCVGCGQALENEEQQSTSLCQVCLDALDDWTDYGTLDCGCCSCCGCSCEDEEEGDPDK